MEKRLLAKNLNNLVVACLGTLPGQPGVERTVLDGAQKKLGRALPLALADFYLAVGGIPEVTSSHHHFVPLEEMRMANGGLAFCRENQDQMFWAILEGDLGASDPPVVQGQPGESQWYPECKQLSTFLLNFACWQLVNAAAASGTAPVGRTTVKVLREHCEVVSATLDFNMASFIDRNGRVIVSALLDSQRVFAGASTDEALEDFEKRTGIELDWL